MKVPFYFSLSEMLYSRTALSLGIKNFPDEWSILFNLFCLSHYLDFVRRAANFPLIVTSGFRTDELNKAVGGCLNSRHLYGLAVDLRCDTSAQFLEIRRIIGRDCTYIEFYPTRHYLHVQFLESFLHDFYNTYINKK